MSTTAGGSGAPASCSATVRPSRSGSWMSSRTISGRRAATASTAAAPLAASPTTSKPSACSSARAEARKAAWSSTMSTVGRMPLIVPHATRAHTVASPNNASRLGASRLQPASIPPAMRVCHRVENCDQPQPQAEATSDVSACKPTEACHQREAPAPRSCVRGGRLTAIAGLGGWAAAEVEGLVLHPDRSIGADHEGHGLVDADFTEAFVVDEAERERSAGCRVDDFGVAESAFLHSQRGVLERHGVGAPVDGRPQEDVLLHAHERERGLAGPVEDGSVAADGLQRLGFEADGLLVDDLW